MKSLTIHTLVVAVALALWGTPSMAAMEVSGQPVNQSETDTHSVQAATAPVPLYALSRLDAETLAEQAMTDQELKAVEGGITVTIHTGDGLSLGWVAFFNGIKTGCPSCTVTLVP